jgi:2-oxoisovalerate dehydrogenase E1 component
MNPVVDRSAFTHEIAQALTRPRLLRVLEIMLLSRAADAKMAKLVKQNKGGTFQLSAAGHELIGAVCASILRPGKDWACAYYRDQPLAIGLGCELVELFGVFLGRRTERQSRGRMMPYHFSDLSRRMPTQSSVVGTQFLPAVGLAQGIRLREVDEVVYVSGGDGATSEGDFHEALNYSALHRLPVVFVIHDNGYAISVPVSEQVAGGSIAAAFRERPGLPLHDVDGCDYPSLAEAFFSSVHRARAGEGPSLIVARVPRLAAHSNSDDPTKYKTEQQMRMEEARDPLVRFTSWLMEEKGFTREEITAVEVAAGRAVEEAAAAASELPFPAGGSAGEHVFVNWSCEESAPCVEGEKLVMVDALNRALVEEMEGDAGVVVFGEDVAHGKGGVFGVTRALTNRFGIERCFNTPLAESTIVGVALGLALDGIHKPVAEIQFADYLWPGFDLLASEVASIHYRSGGEWQVPLVLRMPYGGYIQGGPYHSQSIEGILSHIPGLKVVIPSNAADAKGLLKTAIRDPNPVIFLEHKALYRQAKFCARPDPGADYLLPFGKARVVKEGNDLTVVGWGMMVVMVADLLSKLQQEGIGVELIDLRTIVPVDTETVVASVKKTGKLLVAHEAPRNCGFGAEIAAQVAEAAFEYLDGPIVRVCGLDCAIPYSPPLEHAVLPQPQDLEAAIRDLCRY